MGSDTTVIFILIISTMLGRKANNYISQNDFQHVVITSTHYTHLRVPNGKMKKGFIVNLNLNNTLNIMIGGGIDNGRLVIA